MDAQIDRRRLMQAAAGLALAGCATPDAPPEMQPVIVPPQGPSVWRKLATEPYNGKQDDIAFVSRRAGWYGNGQGKLYRTQDGGATWEKVWDRPGTFIRALGFVDERVGYLGNVGTEYYPNVTDTQPLYRTDDGGTTWTPVAAPGIEAIHGVCGIDILREERIFQGELRKTTLIHAAGRVGGPAAMLRSVDSGATWRTINLSAHAGMILDVKFFDARNGLLCAGSSANTEESNAMILRTSDGGDTWNVAWRSTRPFENCWKMSFPTRQIGYASVQNYQEGFAQRVVVKTTDGGATWHELPLVEDARAQQFGVGFVTPDWGWVGTRSTGYETRDGGLSWAPVAMGQAVNKIRVVREGDSLSAFAIGVDVHRLDA